VRRRSLLLLGLLVVVIAWIVYAGWTVIATRSDLQDARDSATELKQALADSRDAQARAASSTLRDAVGSAHDRTSGPTWFALSHLPFVGNDFGAVRTLSSSLDDLAGSGLTPLVDVAGSLDGKAFTPRHGRIDLAALDTLRTPIARASGSFDTAASDLDAIDTADLMSAVRGPVSALIEDIDLGAELLHGASTAIDVGPAMVGADGPQRWLLVFQNNAEIRATGGLPGSMAVVTADHGKLTLDETRAGHSFAELPQPVLPLTADEQKIYGQALGTWVLDANFTPDFARVADLLRARWERDTGQRLDGVMAVDPVVLSYLLDATGPVTIQGGQLSTANAVPVLIHDVYMNVPDPAAQDAYYGAVTAGVFDHVVNGGRSPGRMLAALFRAANEHRLLIHSFHRPQQKEIAGTEVAGDAFAPHGDHPTVLVTLNDATGAKMQYYLRYDVHVTASCQDGHQAYEASMDLSSTAPKNARTLPWGVTGGGDFGIPAGTFVMNVRIYGPAGGEVGNVLLNGKRFQYERFSEHGRPVAMTPIFLDPGETVTLSWPMTAAAGQNGDTHVNVTPGVVPENESSVVEAACR